MPRHNGYEVVAYACSDLGRQRRTNEDSFFVANLSRGTGTEDDGTIRFSSGSQGCLFAVADGMGGAAAGGVASRICLETLLDEVVTMVQEARNLDSRDVERILIDAIGRANRRVFDLSHSRQEYGGMGTTLTAVFELTGNLVIGQVGDSRAYLIREKGIRQLTRDQSLVGEMLDRGEITEREAREHPDRSVLLQALGVRSSVELSVKRATVHPGDFLLLCSDGLHGQMSADEICEIVLGSGSTAKACMELIRLANGRGGPDNITSVIVEFLPSVD